MSILLSKSKSLVQVQGVEFLGLGVSVLTRHFILYCASTFLLNDLQGKEREGQGEGEKGRGKTGGEGKKKRGRDRKERKRERERNNRAKMTSGKEKSKEDEEGKIGRARVSCFLLIPRCSHASFRLMRKGKEQRKKTTETRGGG